MENDIEKNIALMLKQTPYSLSALSAKYQQDEMDAVFLLAYLGLGVLKQAEALGNIPVAVELFKTMKRAASN